MDVSSLSNETGLPTEEILTLSIESLRELATEVCELSVVDYARVYRNYRSLRNDPPEDENQGSRLSLLCYKAGNVSTDQIFCLGEQELRELARDVCHFGPLDYARIFRVWRKAANQNPESDCQEQDDSKQTSPAVKEPEHEDLLTAHGDVDKDQSQYQQTPSRKEQNDASLSFSHDSDNQAFNHRPIVTPGGSTAETTVAASGVAASGADEEEVDEESVRHEKQDENYNLSHEAGREDAHEEHQQLVGNEAVPRERTSDVFTDEDTDNTNFEERHRKRLRTSEEAVPDVAMSGMTLAPAQKRIRENTDSRPYGDHVLLGYHQFMTGMKALGINTDEIECFDHMKNPAAPKEAGLNGSVEAVKKSIRERGVPFHAFAKRSLTYIKNDTLKEGKFLGWEYLGKFRIDDTVDGLGKSAFLKTFQEGESSGNNTEVWDRATNFGLVTRKEMATNVLTSARRNRYGRRYLDYWRARLKSEIKQQEIYEKENNIKDPVVGPPYLCEGRAPSDNENEGGFNVAARARALNFNDKMDDYALAYLIVELSEFHRMVSIKFVGYDQDVFKALEACATTQYGPTGKKVKPGEECAKASDWYDFFDKMRAEDS